MKNKVIENLIQMYKLPSVMLIIIIIMFRFYFYAKKNNIDEDFGIFFLEAKLSLHVVISENKKNNECTTFSNIYNHLLLTIFNF
jgi:hypothetical protein